MKFSFKGLCFFPLLILLSSCANAPTFLSPHSVITDQQSSLFKLIMYISVAVFILVEFLIIYAVIRFHKRKGDERFPAQIHGNTKLEITWTGLSIVLVLCIFLLSLVTLHRIAAPAPTADSLSIQIIGHQWWWEFDYPGLGIVTANELHIPVNTTVYGDLTSVDVIHSFWVPELSGKVDAIPGQINHIWLTANSINTYDGQCSEYCGANHANMRIKVVVESQDDFLAWVANQQKAPPEPQTDLARQGQKIVLGGICSNCHSVGDNKAATPIGPNLTHLFSRSVFAGALFDLNEDNIRMWLMDNQEMKPFNDMKVTLTPDQVDAIMAYLVTLK